MLDDEVPSNEKSGNEPISELDWISSWRKSYKRSNRPPNHAAAYANLQEMKENSVKVLDEK